MWTVLAFVFVFVTAYRVANTFAASIAQDESGIMALAYPRDVQSERELSACEPDTVCSVIYRRFWLPTLVERHCRCSAADCAWSWSEENDNRTMALDNRSQLKFCSSLENLPDCKPGEAALRVNVPAPNNLTARQQNGRVRITRVVEARLVKATCRCTEPHFWAPDPQDSDLFHCTQLKKCQPWERCGFVRKDIHSTHYLCSCPEGNECLTRDKKKHQHHLLLYSGSVNYAFCLPSTKPVNEL